ncbi:MAG: metallophosphoesterase [Thermoproteota archaeon]
MKLLAVSDVHSPRYLMQYMSALSSHRNDCKEAHFIVWAGDMIDRGRVRAFDPLVKYTKRMCPESEIVAVFGNDEYMDREDEIERSYGEVRWLNDTYHVYSVDNTTIAFYGTRGVLDRPTRWQRRHIPLIQRIYEVKLEKLRENLLKLRDIADVIVVVMHYAPSYKVMEGEPQTAWPEMGSSRVERVLLETKPDIVIHGHLHNAKRLDNNISGIRVYNVAFPARNDLTLIEL